MNRINKILLHPKYQQYYQEIQSLESDRKFCGHTIDHFLSVARLSFIMVLKEGLDIDQEVIYATALLHDIGRYLEYTKGIPHHEASVIIAQEILPECGFEESETSIILSAIVGHRKPLDEGHQSLSGKERFAIIFHQADKLSRNCFECSVKDECNWPEVQKNKGITL